MRYSAGTQHDDDCGSTSPLRSSQKRRTYRLVDSLVALTQSGYLPCPSFGSDPLRPSRTTLLEHSRAVQLEAGRETVQLRSSKNFGVRTRHPRPRDRRYSAWRVIRPSYLGLPELRIRHSTSDRSHGSPLGLCPVRNRLNIQVAGMDINGGLAYRILSAIGRIV